MIYSQLRLVLCIQPPAPFNCVVASSDIVHVIVLNIEYTISLSYLLCMVLLLLSQKLALYDLFTVIHMQQHLLLV